MNSMGFRKYLCRIGIHSWTAPKGDVTAGTEYTKVCEHCRKLR